MPPGWAPSPLSRGQRDEPRLIVLDYEPPQRDATTGSSSGSSGKAITFDSGGISTQAARHDGRHEVRHGRSGRRARRLGAIAELGLAASRDRRRAPRENMPGGRSYRPGDIVTA